MQAEKHAKYIFFHEKWIHRMGGGPKGPGQAQSACPPYDESIFHEKKNIYEVESRAGYPENTDPTAFWGFCIYILLLNVKQLLSIV